MTLGIIILTSAYAILITSLIIGFYSVKPFESPDSPPTTNFSILIPFRNEALHLPELIRSISTLNYPKDKFEVILIDDDSDDDSVKIIEDMLWKGGDLNMQILRNKRSTQSPKKDALTTGMETARFEWILTTDADCTLPNTWLSTMDAFIQCYSPKMVIAPVSYDISNTFLGQFQYLDFLSLQSATISGFGLKHPFLCNGANFAYKKTVFHHLQGFEGNSHVASGDDIFLMEKALSIFPDHVHYLKSRNAMVITSSQPSIASLMQQRRRWVAKMSLSGSTFGKMAGLLILLMNVLVLVMVLIMLSGGLRLEKLVWVFGLKLLLDLLHISRFTHGFKMKFPLPSYVLSALLYPIFSVFVAVSSYIVGFKWKERPYKK
jgi:cellulose synthase/poly-beta-1,6-N-acetylglucosamine synthase-like glycosyltransferase